MMDDKVAELKEQLRQMRNENRLISTENRRLVVKISQIDDKILEMEANREELAVEMSARIQNETKRIESVVSQRTRIRRERRRQVMEDVRYQSTANRELTAEIRAIEAEIERVKKIHEAYPSRFHKKKKLTRKRKAF